MTIETRLTTMQEEILYPGPWIYNKGAFRVEQDGIPAFLGFNWGHNECVGYAWGFQRDETTLGISFDVRVNEEALGIKPNDTGLKLEDYDYSIYANKVLMFREKTEDGSEISRLVEATIRAFVFVPKQFPKEW